MGLGDRRKRGEIGDAIAEQRLRSPFYGDEPSSSRN
jgi:hypothetical protein